MSDPVDKLKEERHVNNALANCGYPSWSFTKCKNNIRDSHLKSKSEDKSKGLVVLPYVKGISEALSRSFRKHDFNTAMTPVSTLKNSLVHPKDRRELEDTSGVVYSIPCASCDSVYIGETSRNFGYRLKEHKKDVESTTANRIFTRAEKKSAQSEVNKSAITDHAVQKNHVIDWPNVKLVDSESNDYTRRIKESIWIKRQKRPMNRDDGAFKLSRIYHSLIAAPSVGGNRH